MGGTNRQSISSRASGFIPTLQPFQLHNQFKTTLSNGGVKRMAGHSVISHKAIKTYGDLPPLPPVVLQPYETEWLLYVPQVQKFETRPSDHTV